jgi:UDP-arabinose 4-epimerase
MKILVTGGAGYIGSHTCKLLFQQGHTPIVVDNLIYGHEWAAKWGPLYQEDILNTSSLVKIIKNEKPEACIHFAAFAYVGESVLEPVKYYKNNVVGSLSLLQALKEAQLNKIVFSSTCATYGIPQSTPIDEDCKQEPINPYGQTKLMVENILKDFSKAYGIKAISLRYFNAAGADKDCEIGESHEPETHLIPLAIRAAIDESKPLTIMGNDYPTPDGTCIRDYIHVSDLAEAHILAVKNLLQTNDSYQFFNLGTGVGTSVNEVVEMIEKISKRKVNKIIGNRRAGDPPALVASPMKANKVLGWKAKQSDLENIVKTAWNWHIKNF